MAKDALAIHGGAGTILRSPMTPELEREYRGGLRLRLGGWDVLSKGGASLDAVEAAVSRSRIFRFSMPVAVLFLRTRASRKWTRASWTADWAGAVAFVKNVKNPIGLARLVMEKTEHVLLAGEGANQFAIEMNVEFADDAYFFTEHRYEQLLRAREMGVVELDHTANEPELVEELTGVASAAAATPTHRSENRWARSGPSPAMPTAISPLRPRQAG